MQMFIGLMLLIIIGIVPIRAFESNGQHSRKDHIASEHTDTSFESKYETINDVRIHYLEWGYSGLPIILLAS